MEKSVTIRFVASGIYQYYDVYVDENDILTSPAQYFYVKYDSELSASLLDCKSLPDVINTLNGCGNIKRAEVYLINGRPAGYISAGIESAVESVKLKLSECAISFFNNEILPILKRNNWLLSSSWCGYPVISEKTESGELKNIEDCDDSFMIDIISFDFLCGIGFSNELLRLKCESLRYPVIPEGFSRLMMMISNDYIRNHELYVES